MKRCGFGFDYISIYQMHLMARISKIKLKKALPVCLRWPNQACLRKTQSLLSTDMILSCIHSDIELRAMSNPFANLVEPLDPSQPARKFFNLNRLGDPRYGMLVIFRELFHAEICLGAVYDWLHTHGCWETEQSKCPYVVPISGISTEVLPPQVAELGLLFTSVSQISEKAVALYGYENGIKAFFLSLC